MIFVPYWVCLHFSAANRIYYPVLYTVAHQGAIRSVAVDGLNQRVITAGADDVIRFWRFKNKQLLEEVMVSWHS